MLVTVRCIFLQVHVSFDSSLILLVHCHFIHSWLLSGGLPSNIHHKDNNECADKKNRFCFLFLKKVVKIECVVIVIITGVV
jgi:hypothetical protein